MSEGAFAAIGALITALVGGAVLVLNAWHRTRQERDTSIAANYQAIADRQEKQIGRLETQLREQQHVIGQLFAAQARCREEEAELYAQLHLLHDLACRHASALRKLGADVEPVPPLPPRPAAGNEEFLTRTTAQATTLLHELDHRLMRPAAGEGGAT